MAMHNTNPLLKYTVIIVVILFLGLIIVSCHKKDSPAPTTSDVHDIKNMATTDNAAEALNTLTAELNATQAKVNEVTQDNAQLIAQNKALLQTVQADNPAATNTMTQELTTLKNEVTDLMHTNNNVYPVTSAQTPQAITVVNDISVTPKTNSMTLLLKANNNEAFQAINDKPKPIPYYTIPPNATSVRDRLMSALVGRIPIKGVVTDPYPFKIVMANDTLAANGLRVPHLTQMIVSGYCEGDLLLRGVRGWVTSLTFVFDDGTLSTTSSNNNNIGNFSKDNSLGYLSDPYGNPFIAGKLITNAPLFLSTNIALGAAQGAASAYAQSQTTNATSVLGNTESVTGSAVKYMTGQAAQSGAQSAQQWWTDRESQSFDAIYVPAGQMIVVNFAKEITIDYDPNGRKLDYEALQPHRFNQLD